MWLYFLFIATPTKVSMAEVPVEKLDEQLNCSICLGTYTDPKILQCFHVYCQMCLEKLLTQNQQGQLSLSCPTCRQVTPVPASGTAGLQSAFHINRLLEIVEDHKKGIEVPSSREMMDTKFDITSQRICCSNHLDREVELYCEKCSVLICTVCAIKGGKHYRHDYRNISESVEKYKAEVTKLLEPVEKRMMAASYVLTQIDSCCDQINHQSVTIKAEIHETCKRLHKIIDRRQDGLIGQLDQITTRKLKSLEKQKCLVESLHAQLSSCLEESLKTIGIQQCELLAKKTEMLNKVKELAKAPQSNILTLRTEADMTFTASSDSAAWCVGQVHAPSSPNPTNCVVTGQGAEESVVGEEATALLKAVNFKGTLYCDNMLPARTFKAELVNVSSESKITCSIEQGKKMGLYVISYTPTTAGHHLLHVKAEGNHISRSPFNVHVIKSTSKSSIGIKVFLTPS